eukprot:scaffold22779_cov137-Cylindrotheca_fusiformis.AAC.3
MLPNFSEFFTVLADYGDMLFAVAIIQIVMTLVAIKGASAFNFWMVAVYPIWSTINCLLVVVSQMGLITTLIHWLDNEYDGSGAGKEQIERASDIVGDVVVYTYVIICYTVLFTLLWTYPSISLAIEIKKGIMTKETYPREQYPRVELP